MGVMAVHKPLAARLLIVAGLLSFLLPLGARAQTVGGSVAGVVRDTTGAVMPGVTVEASSPALIEKVRTAVSDAQGNYRILELRPGTYTVSFTLPGFSVIRREGLELAAGFTATVNAEMRVGGLEETITVAGASPVVDVQNVRQQNVFRRDLLDTLPTNRSVAGFATLTLGAVLNDASQQNVGGDQSEAASDAAFTIHGGRSSDQKLLMDGMPSTDAGFSGNTNKNAINAVAAEETTFLTGGAGADSETGGIQINVIPREGGNSFRAYFSGNGTGSALQSDNLSDEVRDRGLTDVATLRKVWDFAGGIGGPIKRDKLWFYASTRHWGSQAYVVNNYFNKTHGIYIGAPNSGVSLYTPDLDRRAYTDGNLWEQVNYRVTWQITEKQKLALTQNAQTNCDCFREVEDGTSDPAASRIKRYGPTGVIQASWSYPASSRLLVEAGGTYTYYHGSTPLDNGGLITPNDVAVIELSTGYRWGAWAGASNGYAPAETPKKHDQANQRFVLSYVTGTHTLKTGVTIQQGWSLDMHMLNTIGGRAPIRLRLQDGVPDSIDEYTELENNQNLKANLGVFVQDQWTLKRLTLSPGLRFSYYNAYVPAQTIRAPGGRDSMFFAPEFGPDGVVFPAKHGVPLWKDLSPRVGAAYDLFGNGKTAIKGSVGHYVAYHGLTGIPRANTPARSLATSARRDWNDRNGDFVPDCDLVNRFANGECGQVNNLNIGTKVPGTTFADDVTRDNRQYNWQSSVSVQQELRPGYALNVGYFRTWYGNFQVTDNTALGLGDFDEFCVTVPTDSRLGETSGKQICGLYDAKPARFGRVTNVVTQSSNFGKQTEVYDGVDIGVTGRYGRNGIVQGGVSFGRTVSDKCDVLQDDPQLGNNPYIVGGTDPTDRFCHAVNSNQTQVKFAGSYPLPWWGLEVSGTFQNNPGFEVVALRQYSRAEVQGSLGRRLNSSRVEVGITKPYSEFSSRISQLDFRLGKRLTIGRGTLRAQFDLYNMLNSGAITSQIETYGPSWQDPVKVLGGRLAKFGVQFEF